LRFVSAGSVIAYRLVYELAMSMIDAAGGWQARCTNWLCIAFSIDKQTVCVGL
jgi:hypothetical protein